MIIRKKKGGKGINEPSSSPYGHHREPRKIGSRAGASRYLAHLIARKGR